MSKTSKPTRAAHRAARKTFPWKLAIVAAVVVVLLPAGGFAFAASQEQHDAFCGSCHTQPESTYLERSLAGQPTDLASFHAGKDTRCIDCHSGMGVTGRLSAELLGASNAVKWYTGTAIQPAPLTNPIGDSHCLKCHAEVTSRTYVPKNNVLGGDRERGEEGGNGHWHLFLARWQAQSANAAACVSCHSGHATNGDPALEYLNNQQTSSVCNACHQSLGRD